MTPAPVLVPAPAVYAPRWAVVAPSAGAAAVAESAAAAVGALSAVAPAGRGPRWAAGLAPASAPGPGGPMRGGPLTVITLKHAHAEEMVAVLRQVFAAQGLEATADERTNQLILRADVKMAAEVEALIEKLDVQVPKR